MEMNNLRLWEEDEIMIMVKTLKKEFSCQEKMKKIIKCIKCIDLQCIRIHKYRIFDILIGCGYLLCYF